MPSAASCTRSLPTSSTFLLVAGRCPPGPPCWSVWTGSDSRALSITPLVAELSGPSVGSAAASAAFHDTNATASRNASDHGFLMPTSLLTRRTRVEGVGSSQAVDALGGGRRCGVGRLLTACPGYLVRVTTYRPKL